MKSQFPRFLGLLSATAILLGAFVASAWAEPFVRTIEKDIETNSSDVSIPASASGTVLTSICGTACPNSLALAAKTQAFIGKKAVTLAALHDYTVNHRVGVTLFYDPVSKVLTRIIADESRK